MDYREYFFMESERNHSAPQHVARTLRGDDALMRAAEDIAAPRRRLLAGLRDAHLEAVTRITRLRVSEGRDPSIARLLRQAEEQLRRIELLLADLRERPRATLRAAGMRLPVNGELSALAAEEERGAADARSLQDLAYLTGHHLAARLFDLTAAEREQAARDLAAAAARPH